MRIWLPSGFLLINIDIRAVAIHQVFWQESRRMLFCDQADDQYQGAGPIRVGIKRTRCPRCGTELKKEKP